MLCRSTFTFVFFTFFFLACIDAPRFDRDDAVPEGSASATDPRVGMVLVPAATLASEGNVAPSAKGGDDKDDDDDKGKGGGDPGKGGGPPPTPTPPSNPTIDVAAFWIDALEVSASDYAACVGEGACAKAGDGPDCTVASGLGTHPVNCVTFSDAARYCAFKEKRLPRMNEWTIAAGGAARRPFPWGAEAPEPLRLNACGTECALTRAMYTGSDGFARTAPRGSFAAGVTPNGIFDLAGNVAEWVDAGSTAAVRGGSFEDVAASSVGVLSVSVVAPDASSPARGFRCARDP